MSSIYLAAVAMVLGQPVGGGAPAGHTPQVSEEPLLANPMQLTHRAQFVKAGEQYFSRDGRWVIFQAVPVPGEGAEADPFYSMYVAELVARKDGTPLSLEKVTRVSPPGSANTCGWFNPVKPGEVLFGSTLTRPSDEQKSGFQVGSRKYVWMFPKEMEVVTATCGPMAEQAADPIGHGRQVTGGKGGGAAPAAHGPTTLFERGNYDAECSYDASGRFVLYAHIEDELAMGRPDANIYVYDTVTKAHHAIVTAPGYDGGPFFSPDGRRICYRSDRKGDDLLQLFVADLKFERGADGVEVPVGIEREYQLTDNGQVNWAPYWHPSGKFLVYGSSEVGHDNYEIFAVEVDPAKMAEAAAATKEKTVPVNARRARVTNTPGADVLPVFSPDGMWMMWTSQRGPKAEGEAKSSSQVWIARWTGNPFGS